jgi:hypothetical protein
MKNSVNVLVNWSSQKMAKNLPTGGVYSTVARFEEDAPTWPNNAWSIVLEFPEGVAQSASFRATARFLSDEGPIARLRPEVEFEMLEGRTIAAKVRVL